MLGITIAGTTGVFWLGSIWPQRSIDRGQPSSPTPATPQIPTQTATIAEIDAHTGTTPILFHLGEDPDILVLDFPDLHPQAQMLNRVAALIEKADMPRDRVVTEAELDDHIRASGGTPDGYYYGHDYRAADLARFFELAANENIPLNPYEAWLKDLLAKEGWLQPGANGALISIPGTSAEVDASSRTTIFRHELSHGVYFTDPAYVALTKHWWNDLLTDNERAAIVAFLTREGYDPADDDLMENEGQAFFIHTRDPRYFMPEMVGVKPSRDAVLRGAFIEGIPEAWLRDSALRVAPIAPTATPPKLTDEPSSAPVRPPLRDPHAGAPPLLPPPDHR